jgi:probable rRNA maturation factor
MNELCSITINTKSRPSIEDLLFVRVKEGILGKKYNLSIVYVGDVRMRSLNRIYRSKDYVTDILSFPLSDTDGEIYINPRLLTKKSKDFNMDIPTYTLFLAIHGCLHLKGYDHGEDMEKLEKKFYKSYLQFI